MRVIAAVLLIILTIGLAVMVLSTIISPTTTTAASVGALPPSSATTPAAYAETTPAMPPAAERMASENGPARNEALQNMSAERIEQRRQQLDDTIWAKEVRAQEYERSFIALWDALRARSADCPALLATEPFTTLLIRDFAPETAHRWAIRTAAMTGTTRTLDHAAWGSLIRDAVTRGYVLEHAEFHHAAMTVDEHGTAHSTVNIKLFIANQATKTHLVLAGPLAVTWTDRLDAAHNHIMDAIDATHLSMTSRSGDPAFVEVARQGSAVWMGQTPYASMSPVLVYDLSGSGHPDIIIPSINLLWRNHSTPGHIRFSQERLFDRDIHGITAAVIADFTGDGLPDLLVTGPHLAPRIMPGESGGSFGPGHDACPGVDFANLEVPYVITAGDVDGDGKVDFFLAQYRYLYGDGNMPDPYYDANDGYPSFLFLNNGDGTFRDATVASGLSAKRFRRTNAATLVDIRGGKGHLDLLTINDFSGLDVWRNDGAGHFTDITASAVDERSSFGMGCSVADFTNNGRLDVFMTGMGSTTARRLDQLKLGRADYPDFSDMRLKMAYGNRLLLGTADGTLRQAPFADQLARTGWAWGSAACDFGNDGVMDLFITNGFMSRKSAKDYCTRFWTQDIYMANSHPNDAFSQVFVDERERQDASWNGFEHKALLMNEEGKAFRDVAYPMNLGFEWDGREVIGVDIDGDGQEDLVIMQTIGATEAAGGQEILHVVRNQIPSANHWLEVQVRDIPGRSALGATVTVTCADRSFIACIVCGDSYRAQHPATTHFGLGARTSVDRVDIHWPSGEEQHVDHPTVDHLLHL